MRGRIALGVGMGLLLGGCLWGGGTAPDHCEVRVAATEQWDSSAQGLDVAYRVKGKAGSSALVWLVAEQPTGGYLAGRGVQVGPGPFEAIVDLELTGSPKGFQVLLEVAGRRCRTRAPTPG